MRITKTIAAMAVAMIVAQPIAASANTVSAAQKLSLKNAVPGNARASAKAGENKAIGAGLILLIVAGVAGVIAIAASGDSDSN